MSGKHIAEGGDARMLGVIWDNKSLTVDLRHVSSMDRLLSRWGMRLRFSADEAEWHPCFIIFRAI